MVRLAIDLQDGFADDTVAVQVDGEEIYRKEQVTTKLLLGLAESFETEIEKGPVEVEVRVETRGMALTIPLDLSAAAYLGVSIVNGQLEYILSGQPFGYG